MTKNELMKLLSLSGVLARDVQRDEAPTWAALIAAERLTIKVRDDLKRTWARETRLEREQKGLKGLTPQLTGKYANPQT